jgi:hypothetical protein
MEERMTVCNMSIEGGARAGLIAPDETTFQYLEGKAQSPKGKDWDRAVFDWKSLPRIPEPAERPDGFPRRLEDRTDVDLRDQPRYVGRNR